VTPIHKFLRRYKGGLYRLCLHRSHRLRLPCFRLFHWDGQCYKHDDTCPLGCEKG
jgi:hypothetical protein